MAKCTEQGIRLSCMNPAFLNSNSTSHTWPFSAVAELVDNASDPGVCAKQMWIDVVEEKGHLCLTFTDNGCGMTPSKLHKMLSFGFTEKGSGNLSQQAIGVYGNGFKSGSMRLGRDALIFTKNGGCQSVGMMSQTYLENIKAQAVLVPIVPFNQQTRSQVETQDSENNLKAILENSIITSVEEIHAHFDSIPSKKGTKILIWNIRRTKDGKPEIDFETDVTDFRLPSIQSQDIKNGLSRSGSMRHEQDVPEMQYSLKAYLSILYLKPRTQIFLRGKRNIPRLISKGLNIIQHDVYNPHFTNDKVKVTFGMNPGKKGHYGIMLYHKNRLIKAYEKVGCQLKTSGQRSGVGVIGIIECNFLKPAHNKQDFEYTKEYRLTLGALGVKLNDYCKAVMHLWAKGRVSLADGEGEEESAGAKALKWLQCRECLKWRSVPADHYEQVPESWTCSQNPNLRYRSCSVPEEAEEEPSAPIYRKSHKIQDFKKRRRHISKKDHSEEDETLSQCSSEPPESVQSSNASVHSSADGEHTKESTQHAKEQTDHTGDSPLWHPSGRARAPDTEHVEEAREEKQRADRDGDTCQQRTPFTRELVIKGNAHEEEPNREWDERLKDEDEDEEKHTHMESEARAQDNRDTSSNKRKAEPLFSCVNKKSCLQNQQAEAENVEEANPEKEPGIPEMSSEKTNNDRSSRVDEDGDTPERDQSGPPSLDERDRVANLQRLARLEKEVQNLRRLLGLQNSPSSPSPAQGSGDWAEFGQSALAQSVGEEPEEEEGPSRMQSSDSSFADRSSQECLRLIRANVVVLLTVVMPGLDLTNISTETSDVDSILEQVLEFNSCKLKMLPDAPK
ncbi:MORC family CW-type zinc finger protein 3-like isoform X2 [Takifugu flavidus]|uniref:MORC family CW-type zinc finger protein 3-like isoform X2 n=1 Tax=Takifugu flavidus TaxID=433684 RepID=UPI0025446424|nr:MORC family CW-type zinc finger protein 3-like isoform X2 [Takifugu flavidus]